MRRSLVEKMTRFPSCGLLQFQIFPLPQPLPRKSIPSRFSLPRVQIRSGIQNDFALVRCLRRERPARRAVNDRQLKVIALLLNPGPPCRRRTGHNTLFPAGKWLLRRTSRCGRLELGNLPRRSRCNKWMRSYRSFTERMLSTFSGFLPRTTFPSRHISQVAFLSSAWTGMTLE